MPTYTYVGRDHNGCAVEGRVEAANSALAFGKVRALGVEPERVRAEQPEITVTVPRPSRESLPSRIASQIILPAISGVSLKDRAIFFRQFATLVHAGIPIYEALCSLESQARNRRLAAVLREGQANTLAGRPISVWMDRKRWLFGEIEREMVRAAEQGGMLDDMLAHIADYLEQELALRRLVSRLTLYPKIILFVAVMILGKTFFLTKMPALAALVIASLGHGNYTTLNYLNDTLFFIAEVLIAFWLVSAFCRVTLFQSQAIRNGYERIKQAIPGIGSVSKKFALAKFGQAFGAMYAAGVPLVTGIRAAASASGSHVLGAAVLEASTSLNDGMVLSHAFAATGAFSPIVIQMLHTGEQTGNVDAMMVKVSEYMMNEAETQAHLYANIFATVVLLIVAGCIATAIVSFFLGYVGSVSALAGGGN